MPPILNAYIEAIARKYSINNDAAFEILSAAIILDKPFDEVYQNIWVGDSHDCGFDSVYIDDISNIIYVFQSKNSPSLSENKLMKLENDFQDFFVRNNRSSRTINAKLQSLLDEFKDYTNQGISITPKLFFVYSGQNNDPEFGNNLNIANRIFARTTAPEYELIDSEGLVSRIANFQHRRRNRVEFTFKPLETNIPTFSQQALYSFIIGQTTGASFRIKALHLCELIEKEISVNGFMDTLFSENIRGYLGNNKTNKNIFATLKDRQRSSFFPFMNNGLTIICESIFIPPVPQANQYNISVVNPVIVNGLQTTRIIYDVYLEDRTLLDDVYITLKVCESRDSNITDLITEATNTQTSINFRDQISNKVFNEHANVYFASKGVKYISKRGQIVQENNLNDGLLDSVNNEIVIKFWYATYKEDPHLAKISKSSVLENIFLATKGENPILNDIFNGSPESPLYKQLFIAYQIQKIVASKRFELENQLNKDYLLHADEIISYGIYLQLKREGLLDDPLDHLNEKYLLVQQRIEDIVEREKERRGESYAHTKYFKSESIVQDYNQIV